MGKKLVLCKKSSKLATIRKVKIFFGSMGDTYKRSRNFRNCKGVHGTFSKKSNTGESSPDATHGSGTSRSNTSGDREHVEEGGHTTNRASGWVVFKQYFLGWGKRWVKSTCGELKVLKLVHFMSTFQNVRFVLRPRITAEGRLHVQAGYERCLFFNSIASLIKELCLLFMVRESLRVPLLMFRLGTRISQNLHKIAKNTSVCPEEDEYSGSNIFGRCAYYRSNNGRNYQVQRQCNLPPALFRFCFKPGKVHFESCSGNRVPWGDNKFSEDMSFFTTKEGVKNPESVSGCPCQRSGDSSLTNKIVRSSCLNNSGSFASSTECSISSATANKSIESNSMLSSNCITQQQFKGGTSVVDPKSPDFQWELPNSASSFLTIRTDASKKGWGAVCQEFQQETSRIYKNNNFI